MPGGSESSSSSSQSTSTQTTDRRIGADNASVVITDSGSQNISFSPEVAKAGQYVVDRVTDFSKGVVSTAGDILQRSISAQENLTNSVLDFGKTALAAAPSTSQSTASQIVGSQSTGDIINALKLPLTLAAVGLVLFFVLKKK